jgi:hypothetical protein
MKTFLVVLVTAVVTGIGFHFYYGLRTSEWLIGAIKTPGGFAIREIQTDMNAKRYDVAKEKIDAFMNSWQKFSSGPDSCSGAGISDIPITFSRISGDINTTNVVPDNAANGSKPINAK